MDKTATILINREQVQKMLGGLSKSSFSNWSGSGKMLELLSRIRLRECQH